MQVALADGQSKIEGILEVNWNINLITRNKGKRKQEIPLLEFCKNSQRADHVNNVDSTCFCCWNDLSYGLNTLGPLCLWQCLQNSRSSISCFRIPLFLVIRFIFQFTSKVPKISLWPSASGTCIYGSRLCINSMQDWTHLFCRTGKGFAPEHVVRQSHVSWRTSLRRESD